METNRPEPKLLAKHPIPEGLEVRVYELTDGRFSITQFDLDADRGHVVVIYPRAFGGSPEKARALALAAAVDFAAKCEVGS